MTAMRALQCGGVRMATLPEEGEEVSVSTKAVATEAVSRVMNGNIWMTCGSTQTKACFR